MRPHLHLLGILQTAWGLIGLLLGVSTLLLAVGAIAIGITSPQERMAAGVTDGRFTCSTHFVIDWYETTALKFGRTDDTARS